VCKRILPLSATPILNRIGELWTPLYMVAPEVFYSEDRFLSRYTYDGKVPKDVDKLHQLIRPVFLRRRKNEVLKDLPPINRIIQYYTLSERAQILYNRVLQGIYEELKEYDPSGIGGQSSRVFNLLSQFTRLKKICAADKREHTVALASELERLGNGKVLIFSQFKGSAYAIHRELGSESVCTVERNNRQFISMDAKQRDELFESVRHVPRIRYIVTTNASEEGHNLEFCDYVIFNDLFWTPKSHMQCEGRAYGRLSNPHPIDSYYIITETSNGEKSIEHIIINILSEKMRTFEEVVEGVEASREKDISVAMELIRILKEGL
jgi:SNF2 family DNA or RNA helicase